MTQRPSLSLRLHAHRGMYSTALRADDGPAAGCGPAARSALRAVDDDDDDDDEWYATSSAAYSTVASHVFAERRFSARLKRMLSEDAAGRGPRLRRLLRMTGARGDLSQELTECLWILQLSLRRRARLRFPPLVVEVEFLDVVSVSSRELGVVVWIRVHRAVSDVYLEAVRTAISVAISARAAAAAAATATDDREGEGGDEEGGGGGGEGPPAPTRHAGAVILAWIVRAATSAEVTPGLLRFVERLAAGAVGAPQAVIRVIKLHTSSQCLRVPRFFFIYRDARDPPSSPSPPPPPTTFVAPTLDKMLMYAVLQAGAMELDRLHCLLESTTTTTTTTGHDWLRARDAALQKIRWEK